MTACPVCGKEYDTTRYQVGQKLRCGSCRTRLKVGDNRVLEMRHVSEASGALEPVERQDRFEEGDLPDLSSIGYECLEKIGEGGMGTVFKVEHQLMQRISAVKILKKSFSEDKIRFERFLIEARSLAKLNHENILKIFDVKNIDDLTLMILEYIEGKTLIDVLREYEKLPPEQAFDYLHQCAQGLGEAHAVGIIHRDIKPGNLILEGDVVKIADFGLARSVAAEVGVTRVGQLLGTPLYMSPEQAQGEKADARSDIYGLGASFFHLLAGRPPFTGMGISNVLKNHIQKPPPNLRELNPHVSEDFAILIGRMMAKSPEHRFKDGNELATEMDDFLQSRSIRAVEGSSVAGADLPPTLVDVPLEQPGENPIAAARQPLAPPVAHESAVVEAIPDRGDDIFAALAESGMPSDGTGVVESGVKMNLEIEVPDKEDALMSMLSDDPGFKDDPEPEPPPPAAAALADPPMPLPTMDLQGEELIPDDDDDTRDEEDAEKERVPESPGASDEERTDADLHEPASQDESEFEDIRPENLGDWQELLLPSLLDPLSGAAMTHLLLLAAGGAAAFTVFGVAAFTTASNMVDGGNASALVCYAGTGIGLMLILTTLCGFWTYRARWMLQGKRIGSMPTIGSPINAIRGGIPLFLVLLAFFLLPIATNGFGLGFFILVLVLSAGCLLAPLALIGLATGRPLSEVLSPGYLIQPHVLGSMKFLPAALIWSTIMLVITPGILLLLLLVPAAMANNILEPHLVAEGASTARGIAGIFLLAFFTLLLNQYSLWAGGCLLFRAWLPRQDFFAGRTPKSPPSAVFAAALALALCIGLVAGVLFKLNMTFGGGSKLARLLYGPQVEAPTTDD